MLQIGEGEPAFWPLHLFISIITLVIFFLIVLLISRIYSCPAQRHLPIPINQFKPDTTFALVSLVATLVGLLITSFLQVPVLDYTVSPLEVNDTSKPSVMKFTTRIQNYGFVSAKNVIISMRANNVLFLNPISEPHLGRHIHNYTIVKNNIGMQNVEIDAIPVRSVTDITTFINRSNVNKPIDEDIIINVRSDESIGNRGTYYLISYYVILALFYMFAAGLLVAGVVPREERNACIITLIFAAFVLFLGVPVNYGLFRT